jgi:hypothetical protein
MPAHTITIAAKSGEKKVIHTTEAFGVDAKGQRMSPSDVQAIARDIAWDTFGFNTKYVQCQKDR